MTGPEGLKFSGFDLGYLEVVIKKDRKDWSKNPHPLVLYFSSKIFWLVSQFYA